MKLQTEQIQGYLAHGLRFISELDKPYEEFGKNTVHTLNGIEELFGDYCLISKQLKDAYPTHLCKPILRKLDLTKSIKVNGVESKPIVELAKIAFPNVIHWHIAGDSSCRGGDDERYRFAYRKDLYAFVHVYYGLHISDGHVPNQKQLFKWLYANLFDVDNLIDKGLAIDADTLEINPYNN